MEDNVVWTEADLHSTRDKVTALTPTMTRPDRVPFLPYLRAWLSGNVLILVLWVICEVDPRWHIAFYLLAPVVAVGVLAFIVGSTVLAGGEEPPDSPLL